MTGYAKISQTIDGVEHTFELKTLNHKYVDIKLNVPKMIEPYEMEISEILRNEIKRGSVRAVYTVKNVTSVATKFDVDIDIARSYYEAYLMVAKSLKLNYIPDVSVIMKHNGVLNTIEEDTFKDKDLVLGLVLKATRELNKFRESEGKRLAKFIGDRLKMLGKSVEKISKLVKNVKQIHFDKMKERLAEFTKKVKTEVDENRMLQELVLFIDRSDISEELERLESHIKYFETLLKGDANDPIVGRKMDFLCQELFREITTLSNKTNLIEVTKIAIDVKSEIEKIREQVQNIQ